MTHSMFSATLPTLQIAWDSSSLSVFKTCPRKYQYQYISQRHPKGSSIHLTFGSAYHKALEIYDHKKSDGLDHEEATHEAIRYCLTFSDGPDPDPNKNKFTLTRTVAWYLEQFTNDACETIILDNGKPAVELSFKLELTQLPNTTPEGEPYLLCGHLDRLVSFQESLYFLDRKTTKGTLSQSYFNQFTPNNQMTIYHFASNIILPSGIAGGIIDAAQIGVGFSRFARTMIHRSPDMIEEFLGDLSHYLSLAEHYATDNYWPMNDKACGDYGGCPFQSICSRPPSIRNTFLNDNFYFTSSLWNPLEIRGDI